MRYDCKLQFVYIFQWRRKQIQRGGARLIRNLDKQKKKYKKSNGYENTMGISQIIFSRV